MEEGINVFSIKDLENFSGIKAHTIRIWEKRYGILDPERTDTNIRTYNESELKKILNVAYLNRNGLKISKIARLSEDELTQKVMTVSSSKDRSDQDFQPGKVLMSAIRFDEGLFIRTLEPFIRARGIEQAYCLYLHPLLLKARILWQTGSLSRAQEQFIRNVIRQIITVEESRLKGGDEKTRHAVAMINTSDNLCENNFLFYKYVLKKRGFDVIYTGDILPASEVVEMFRIKPFDFLVVNSSGFDFARKKIGYFSNIARSLMIRKIILTDFPGKNDQKLNDRILVASDPSEFIKCIDNLD
ncbi:MAG TPA: MerR family transcriptional regulator [Bacteroidales bacterium]|nr:MerR family transcriptional regulator [Bacteroidales bacterium]HPR11509.1 MerR family transcriptional regulator [Bacteroidales bacterium]HRW84251.1 MerR family transcriptional regulator [Bacteroidales bacterium]